MPPATKKRMAVLDAAKPSQVELPKGLPGHPQAATPWGLTDLGWKNSKTPPNDDVKMPHGLEPQSEDENMLFPSPIPVPHGKAKR